MNQIMPMFSIYEEIFAKYIDIKNLRLILFPLSKRMVKTVYFGEILTKYTPRDEHFSRTNFRATTPRVEIVPRWR